MEPSSGSAVGFTISVGTISVVGTLMGMHYDSLLFGLFGGLLFLAYGKAGTRSNAIAGAIASALIAGVGSPILASFFASMHSSFDQVDHDTVRRACALFLGGGWQALLPPAYEALKKWLTKDR